MCFFFSLIPATIWAVIGFFVLFTAAKAEGPLKMFGKALAIWIFIITVFFPLGGAYVSISGSCPMDRDFRDMHRQGQIPFVK